MRRKNASTPNLPPSRISSPNMIRRGGLTASDVLESWIFIVGLLTSLLLLFSLIWFPHSPPAVLKRQERCASYNQKGAGRGSWQRVKTVPAL